MNSNPPDNLQARETEREDCTPDHSLIETLSMLSGTGICEWNLSNSTQHLSTECLRLFGWEREARGCPRAWQHLLSTDDTIQALKTIENHLHSDTKSEPFQMDLMIFHRHGRLLSILLKGQIIEWDQEEPVRIILSLSDRSETLELKSELSTVKQALQHHRSKVKSNEDQLSAIINSMYDALITFNEVGTILTWNSAAVRMFGIPSEDALGQNVSKLMPSPLDTQATRFYKDIVHDQSNAYFGAKTDVIATRGDKTKFEAELSLSTYQSPKSMQYIATVRDSTLKKKALEALTKSQQAAEEANLSKSQFLANMSHELRTPLNSIIGFNQILQEELFGPLNEKQKHYLEIVRDSSTKLLHLIDEILDLAKLESGKLQFHYIELDINSPCQSTVLSFQEAAQAKGIKLSIDIDGFLPKIRVDVRRFEQVLRNLISNSVKFTPRGGSIRVSVKSELSVPRPKHSQLLSSVTSHYKSFTRNLIVSVKDDGIGIPEAKQSSLFGNLQQVDAKFTRQQKGAGLGLALSKKLVEAQGGKIWFKSEHGGPKTGSHFYISFPETLSSKN